MQGRLSGPIKIAASRTGAPGLEIWLALLFIGVCVMAWVKNEAIVAWALAEGLVDEAATGMLLNAVRYASLAAGVLGLVAAWRIFAWSAWGVYRWTPVRTFTAHLLEAATPLVSLVRSLIDAITQVVSLALRFLGLVLTTVFRWLKLAMSIVAGLILLPLHYLSLGLSVVFRYLWPGVVTVLGHLWVGVSAVALALSLVLRTAGVGLYRALRYAWRGVVTILGYLGRALGMTLRFAWMIVWTPSVYASRGVATTLGYLWPTVAATVRFLWQGVTILAQAISLVLRTVGLGLSRALRFAWMLVWTPFVYVSRGLVYTWRGIGFALRYLRPRASTILGYLARALGMALRFAWMIVWTPFIYASRGVVYTLRSLRLGIATVYGYLGRSLSVALRYAWMVVSRLFAYAGRGLVFAPIYLGLAVSTLLRFLWPTVATSGHFLWQGVTTVAQAISLVLRTAGVGLYRALQYAWLGVASIIHHLVGGVTTIALAMGLALHYLGLGISTILRYLWAGVSAIAQVVGLAIRFIGAGISVMAQAAGVMLRHLFRPVALVVHYLWLGISTLALLLGGMWGLLRHGMTGALRGMKRGGLFVMRTAWTGFGAMPDVGRKVVWLARHRKGVSEMSNSNLNRQRVLSLIATLWVLGIAGFFVVRVVWPPPPEPTVEVMHWATGHLMREGRDIRLLPVMAEEFNKAGHRTQSGTRIVVNVHNVPSELISEYLVPRVKSGRRINLTDISGGYVKPNYSDPTIVTPSSTHWLVTVNYEVGHTVADPSSAPSIVRPVIGIVTYEEMARCLGWPEKELGYADILALRADPEGWKRFPCASPKWGQRPLVAYTDPTTSDTGRGVLLALYSIAAGKLPEQLTPEDVKDPEVVSYVKQFQGLVDHYLIGTTVLNTKVHQGTRYGHFFIMPEDNLIHLYEGTERAFINGVKVQPPSISQRMVMIYPKEGSISRNNCACIVQADWVTPEQVEAAEKWIQFLQEDQQQRDFMAAGFRPGGDISRTDPASKINDSYGLDPTKPTVELDLSLIDPAVAAAIDDSWELVKRPGIVTFVVDTSGSMMGPKIEKARDGLVRALGNMAKNNQVGLLTFSQDINTRVPVAPLTESGFKIADAAHEMRARGETALYDAIKAGIEMTDAAEGEAESIRAVVVLTDGRANRGQTKLHDLIQMRSSDETAIRQFGGFENETPTLDGTPIDKASIVGVELAIETRHPIQVFFIGIGDADLDIGRILSQATGAEFQGATEEDLANVLEEFSKYF